jgi:hypothetical protein
MADKAPKPKSVLGTLPASRPERIGAPRSGKAKPRAVKRAPATPKLAPKPRAVSPGAPPLTREHPCEAPPAKPIGVPKGTELVTTAIRATGELAQIGFTLGGQALKRAVDRFPKP